jgi:hypothetical protein
LSHGRRLPPCGWFLGTPAARRPSLGRPLGSAVTSTGDIPRWVRIAGVRQVGREAPSGGPGAQNDEPIGVASSRGASTRQPTPDRCATGQRGPVQVLSWSRRSGS